MQLASKVPLCTAKAVALCGIIASAGLPLSKAEAWNSELLGYNSTTGALTYNSIGNTLNQYNAVGGRRDSYRLPDFGAVGYRHGAPLPNLIPRPSTVATITTTNDTTDRTADIQAAIDAVGLLPVQANGYRGTVYLGAGTFYVRKTIRLNKSGIILSGYGSSTILKRPYIDDDTDPNNAPNTRPTGAQETPVVVIGNTFSNSASWTGTPATNFAVWRASTGSTGDSTSATDTGAESVNFRNYARSFITDTKVGVGATTFHVSDSNSDRYVVGDKICLVNKPTDAWLASVNYGGMDEDDPYWGKDGIADTSVNLTVRYLREITKITPSSTGGDATITVDAPIFMDLLKTNAPFIYKSNYRGEGDCSGTVTYSGSDTGTMKRIGGYDVMVENCGLQNLFIDIDYMDGYVPGTTKKYETHCNNAVKFVRAQDCWVRSITAQHFIHSGVIAGKDALRCTVQKVTAQYPRNNNEGGQGYNFCTDRGQLILFEDCVAQGGRHNLAVNGAAQDSGIVFRNCRVDDPREGNEPHMAWSTGILFDGMTTSGTWGDGRNILDFSCQGKYGGWYKAAVLNPDGTVKTPANGLIGHGWTSANAVAWRCDLTNQDLPTQSGQMFCQRPPTAQNFAIGCKGWITQAQTTSSYGSDPNCGDFRYKSNSTYERSLLDFMFEKNSGPGHVEPRGGTGLGSDIDTRYTIQLAKYNAGDAFAAVSLTPLTAAAQKTAFDTLEPKSLHEAQRNVSNRILQTEDLVLDTAATTPGIVHTDDYTDSTGILGTNFAATAAGQSVAYTIPNVSPGTYRISVGLKGYTSKGIIQLSTKLASGPVTDFLNRGVPVNGYSASSMVSEVEVGTYAVTGSSGDRTFRFTVTDKDASSTGYGVTLDYIRIQRLY